MAVSSVSMAVNTSHRQKEERRSFQTSQEMKSGFLFHLHHLPFLTSVKNQQLLFRYDRVNSERRHVDIELLNKQCKSS